MKDILLWQDYFKKDLLEILLFLNCMLLSLLTYFLNIIWSRKRFNLIKALYTVISDVLGKQKKKRKK